MITLKQIVGRQTTIYKKYRKALIALLVLGQLMNALTQNVKACSTFLLSNGSTFVYGRNFDYPYSKYIVMMNMRGAQKVCWQYSFENVTMPLTWTAKYGSMTFNLIGKDTPTDGMNEQGLVISALILEGSVYPNVNGQSSILIEQLLQYLLDNCASVNEVIDECSKINIRNNPNFEWELHYFVADNTGQAAVIEFMNGSLVATTGANLEKKAITNSSYEESIAYFHDGVMSGDPENSWNRYYNVVSMLDAYNGENLLDYSYSIMGLVEQRITERSMVYDIPNRRVNFKSSGNQNLRYFDLSSFDFSCTEQPKVYRESGSDAGNISNKFINYTTDINRTCIQDWWNYLNYEYGFTYTQDQLNNFAQYPESFGCIPTSTGEDLFGLEETESFSVFPNPVGSILNFSCKEFDNSNVKVAIFDIKGQIVYEDYLHYSSNNNQSIFIGHLPKGIYTINLWSDEVFNSKKFVK